MQQTRSRSLQYWLFEVVLLFIITIPSFFALLNNAYFSMHDDQHIVRLYLLDQGLRQGDIYPRWVDGLGFGFGYPLFNFYPPVIYYIAESFHLLGFSLIWSIKLTLVLGFVLGAWGIYLFAKRFVGRPAAFLSAAIYTYFFYHTVLIYVRGALAEFFSLAIIPLVFLALDRLSQKTTVERSVLLGIAFALLVLTHPLIAFPTLFYFGFFLIFYLWKREDKRRFLSCCLIGLVIGLSLSAFFWLPSLVERQHTLVDDILTKELANYKIHYIYPRQFINSLWGYGGSIAGPYDGMTFQLGKIPIGLSLLSLAFCFLFRKRTTRIVKQSYFFFLFLLIFSLFMTTAFSSFIWDNVKYLWYLQFPWRFMTFVGFFISLTAGYTIAFLKLLGNHLQPRGLLRTMLTPLTVIIIIATILIYQKYFRPQKLLATNDAKLTTREEISWRVSRSSFEFVPKGVITKKTDFNTSVVDIDKNTLPKKPYEILSGKAQVKVIKNDFDDKRFVVNVASPTTFKLNTYYFPGWRAYLNDQSLLINNDNEYQLITVHIPAGKNQLVFRFQNTLVRTIANSISVIAVIFILGFFFSSVYLTNSKR